jgi:hypothetical protein
MSLGANKLKKKKIEMKVCYWDTEYTIEKLTFSAASQHQSATRVRTSPANRGTDYLFV